MKQKPILKNNLIIFGLLLLASPAILSQSIQKLYVNMPDAFNPTLTKQNRMELLEYHKAGKGDSITNRFGHQSYLLSYDTLQQKIVVKNTPGSTFEMKIMKLDDNKPAIGIIRTVCAPVCLSSVEFYDTAWNSIPVRFTMPKAIEWLDVKSIPTDKIDVQWARSLMSIGFITLRFSDKNQQLIAKNNTLDFLSVEDRKVIAPYVAATEISFELKGRTWQRKQ